MIWVLVCINMYRYERNFGFLPQSNNSETVSILSKWVNIDLMDDRRFLLKYNDREKFYHRCVCVQVKCENQM